MRITGIRTGLLLLLSLALAFGQTAEKSPSFDVASVKAAAPPTPDGRGMIRMAGPSGGPDTKDPGRIHYPYMTLKNLIMDAYDVKNFQVSGPAWLDTERFDITATMPPDTTKEQFRMMLQNLLAERFKMAVHRETKDLPMYSLVVARSGPKIKESAQVAPPKDGDDSRPPLPERPKIGPDGFPELPGLVGHPGIFGIMMPGRARMIAQQQTMFDLAERLTRQLNRPVKDETGLTGKYDFTVTYAPEMMNGPMGPMPAPPPPPAGGAGPAGSTAVQAEEPLPNIYAALQAQLGLKLEPKKAPLDLIVVDHAEKTPTEN